MLGWFRRYKQLQRENAELKEEIRLDEELIAALEENVRTYEKLASAQRENLEQLRISKRQSEQTVELVLAHLAIAVYYKRDPLITIGDVFKSMSPETCARVAELIITGRSNKC